MVRKVISPAPWTVSHSISRKRNQYGLCESYTERVRIFGKSRCSRLVATIETNEWGNGCHWEANAALIAAAPEMLDVLEQVDLAIREHGLDDELAQKVRNVLTQARDTRFDTYVFEDGILVSRPGNETP